MHPGFDVFPSRLPIAKSFISVAKFPGIFNILGADPRYSLAVTLSQRTWAKKASDAKNRKLVRRVMSLNIAGGVGLRVAKVLRSFKTPGKSALLAHFRENIIRRPFIMLLSK
jgi:hypothetical protein